MNWIDLISRNARIYAGDVAFVEVKPVTKVRKGISWGRFNERVLRLANALFDRGVKEGNKVFLLGRNSINWLEAYFASMATGAWIVPLNFRFVGDDLKYCANVAEPVAFILDEEYARLVSGLAAEFPTIKHYICIGSFGGMESMEGLIAKASPALPDVEMKDEDECALYFTSGTTGSPKPVLLTHKSMVCVALNEATNNRWDRSDSLLMMPPFYHLAIGHLLGCMLAGGRAILLTERITPRYIFESISDERVSIVFLLVPWALDIIEALDKGDLRKEDYDFSCWRWVFMGAQPVPPSLIQRWKKYFPEMQFDNTYGLSETAGPGVVHLGIGNERKIGAIGKPGLLWDARIVDEEGEDVPIGGVGELIVKGDGVMKGYYKNPELTAKAIRKGWLYTGDLARKDEEGFIYLVDRKKDLIISGGENIYPVEVEVVIQKYPKVRDVAVVGTSNERLGEIVTAIIEPKAGEVLTQEEMQFFFEQNLPRYKRPRRMIFDHVPRSPTGKIEKPKLREKYSKPK
jgi:long-chain acyl-CoA synthetase